MADTKNKLTIVEENLSGLLENNIKALPKNFNKTRFLQNCLTVLQETKDIDKCDPVSIARTMIKGAYLGLDFFNRECYAIPFSGQVQFLTDYKGDIKLCRQYSIKPIKEIYAKLVREGDNFEAKIINGIPVINFSPVSFSDADIIGAFAVVIFEDGAMQYATMSKKEISATRQNWSKCPNSPAWTKAYGEMAQKTVLKRLTKLIGLNFDNSEQDKAYEDGGDLKRDVIDVQPSPEVVDPFKGQESDQGDIDTPKPEKTQNSPHNGANQPIQEDPKSNDEGFILQVQNEIKQFLKARGKSLSLVYKYSKDIFGKPLSDLGKREIVALKNKVLNGDI